MHVYCNAYLLSHINQLSCNAVIRMARLAMAMEHRKMETYDCSYPYGG
jgi:hypothetical protein